jgi:hypothetical protein
VHAGGDKEWGGNKAAMYGDLNDNLIRKWRGQKITIKRKVKRRERVKKRRSISGHIIVQLE